MSENLILGLVFGTTVLPAGLAFIFGIILSLLSEHREKKENK